MYFSYITKRITNESEGFQVFLTTSALGTYGTGLIIPLTLSFLEIAHGGQMSQEKVIEDF
jgi:hypothetical protein